MQKVNRQKQLAKNTLILSIGTICSKLFTFLLLPLYTNALTTEDYGNIDVLQTVINLAVPIVTLQLSGAVFRFLIDKGDKKDKSEIITTAFLIVILDAFVFCVCTAGYNALIGLNHFELFLMSFLASSMFLMVQNIARGFGHNLLYSVSSFVLVVTSLLINIVLIVGVGLKGESILIAIALSNLIASIIIICKERLWQYVSIKCFSYSRLKELLQYSLPLVPNAISWWIANTSDRLIIAFFLGNAANGIYAAANKIPTIYMTIYNVFNMAWTESISRSQEDKDKDKFINGMLLTLYRFFGCLCVGIICCMSLLFPFLIGKNYFNAYNHVYILMVAIFFNSMCAMYGGIFTGYKKSKTIGTTTIVGAIVNIVINFLFVRIWGLYAASISTLVSYIVIMIVRVIKANKLIKLVWPYKYFVRMALALAITSIGYFYGNNKVNCVILCGLIIWSVFENKNIITNGTKFIVSKIIRK